VQNGELGHVSPKVIVIHVGSNNFENTAEEIAGGIEAIAKYVSQKQPQAYIVVLSLLPRGKKPNPLREKLAKANQLLPGILSAIPKTQLVNIDTGFVQQDGTISHHDMFDYLHLTRQGYQRAFEPVYDLLMQLLCE